MAGRSATWNSIRRGVRLHPSVLVVSAVPMHDACLSASGVEADTYIYVVATGCSVDPI